MNKQIEALKMAVEALENIELLCDDKRWYLIGNARKACKEALAEAEKQEPVALIRHENGNFSPAPSWQSLSDDEKWNLINNSDIPADYDHEVLAITCATEAKLKEKNYG